MNTQRTASRRMASGPTGRAQYLTTILATGDPSLLAAALGRLAREYGMREVAAAAGLSREALYKALRLDAQPRFATINRVFSALGLKLVARRAGRSPARNSGHRRPEPTSTTRKEGSQ